MPICHLTLRAPKPLDPQWPTELRHLGDHLRRKRLEQGLTQRQVARYLGVDPDTVWNWESDATSPALRLLPKVLDYLGFDPRVTGEPGNLGAQLRLARTAAGLSIEELAKKWSLDPTTMRNILVNHAHRRNRVKSGGGAAGRAGMLLLCEAMCARLDRGRGLGVRRGRRGFP